MFQLNCLMATITKLTKRSSRFTFWSLIFISTVYANDSARVSQLLLTAHAPTPAHVRFIYLIHRVQITAVSERTPTCDKTTADLRYDRTRLLRLGIGRRRRLGSAQRDDVTVLRFIQFTNRHKYIRVKNRVETNHRYEIEKEDRRS